MVMSKYQLPVVSSKVKGYSVESHLVLPLILPTRLTLLNFLVTALTVETVPISIVDRSIITARMTETVLLPK